MMRLYVLTLLLGPREHLVTPLSVVAVRKNLDQLYSSINHHRTTTNLSDIVWCMSGGVPSMSGVVWWYLEHFWWCLVVSDALMGWCCWCCWCTDAMMQWCTVASHELMLRMCWCNDALMHWFCWNADAADALILLMRWYCWCADAADALLLLVRWCCWCADVLMHWRYWIRIRISSRTFL